MISNVKLPDLYCGLSARSSLDLRTALLETVTGVIIRIILAYAFSRRAVVELHLEVTNELLLREGDQSGLYGAVPQLIGKLLYSMDVVN